MRSAAIWLAAFLPGSALAATLEVAWAPPPAAVDGYQVERRVDAPGSRFVPFVRVSRERTRFVDGGLEAGVRHCYRVRGVRGLRVSPPSAELCDAASTKESRGVAPAAEDVASPPAEVQPRAAAAGPSQPAAGDVPAPTLLRVGEARASR